MDNIVLPPPQLDRDYPLMKAIELRRTRRKFTDELLTLQEISDILWCACGETKKATKRTKNRRTVASGCNSQLVDVYACVDTGVYKYNAVEHRLDFITSEDVRSILSTQKKLFSNATFGLIYVGDFSKRTGIIKSNEGQKMFLAGTETGLMCQNVYLYSATADLNTAMIALVNREPLAKAIGLGENEVITYTQIIGKAL